MKKTFWVNVYTSQMFSSGFITSHCLNESKVFAEANAREANSSKYIGTYPIEIDVPEKSITITESEFDKASCTVSGVQSTRMALDLLKQKLFGKGE